MSLFTLIVFPPFTGGHHLAQMLSTAFVTYSQQQLDTIYDVSKNEVDGNSYLYAEHPVACHHIEHAINFVDNFPNNKESLKVIVLNLPQNKNTALAHRIMRRGDFMRWTNVFDLYQWTYTQRQVSRILQINESQITELDCNVLMLQSPAEIFSHISHIRPCLEQCQVMHQRWLSMIQH